MHSTTSSSGGRESRDVREGLLGGPIPIPHFDTFVGGTKGRTQMRDESWPIARSERAFVPLTEYLETVDDEEDLVLTSMTSRESSAVTCLRRRGRMMRGGDRIPDTRTRSPGCGSIAALTWILTRKPSHSPTRCSSVTTGSMRPGLCERAGRASHGRASPVTNRPPLPTSTFPTAIGNPITSMSFT